MTATGKIPPRGGLHAILALPRAPGKIGYRLCAVSYPP
jgi:hypothetical protein